MKKITYALIMVTALFTGCRNAAGPTVSNSPGGPCIVWFNGLSATADGYWTGSDSLIPTAWITGTAPNQIRELNNGEFAVLSSLSAELTTGSVNDPGTALQNILFPQGSNPYCFCVNGDTGYASLLLLDSIAEFSLTSGTVTGSFPCRSNPSGVETAEDKVFAGFGSWPDNTSPGGVSVYNRDGEELNWLDTGVNTHLLKLQPTGSIHCYSTTYSNDGAIGIIDPSGNSSLQSVILCGGAPGESIFLNGEFIAPDGFGRGGLVIYDENGNWERQETPFAPTGLAHFQGVIYATCFGNNTIYMLDPESYAIIDSLASGGEGPQGIVAVNPGG